MSEMDELATQLSKSTVSQLKDQCVQRSLPLTPANKSDLVSRLVDYLKDNPEDELNKVLKAGEEEDIMDTSEEPTMTGLDSSDELDTGEKGNVSGQVEKEDQKNDLATKTTETAGDTKTTEAAGATKTTEAAGDSSVEMKDVEIKEEPQKDGGEKKDQDSSKEDQKVKKFIRPTHPDSRMLNSYRTIDARRRSIVIFPLSVKDLAREDVQQFLHDEVDNFTYHLNHGNPGPDLSNGHIFVVFKTLELAAKKFDAFPRFKEGLTVKRLSENINATAVLKDAFPESSDEKKKGQTFDKVPVAKRTICAHFVPEGTSEEKLQSLFPEVRRFLWARNDEGVYKRMLFMEYETEEIAVKQWGNLVKGKIYMDDIRIWFHIVKFLPGKNLNPLLTEESRRFMNLRKEQLKMEIGSKMLSEPSLQILQMKLKKIEESLEADRIEQLHLKAQRKQENREAKLRSNFNQSPAKAKADLKTPYKNQKQNKQQNKDAKKKKPRPPTQKQQQRKNRQQNRNTPPQNPSYGQQDYNRWSNHGNQGYQNRSPGAYRPQRGMNEGYSQPQMGPGVPTCSNPQAAANAVSLLVGLSSILGGNMRRQTGDGGSQYRGYQDRPEGWSGNSGEEPRAKRGRYSGGDMY